MPLKKNNPGCGCCEDCALVTDTLDAIGAGWDEREGDWSADDGAAIVDSGSALMIYTGQTFNGPFVAYLIATADTAGDEARLVFAYEDDDNYFFAQARVEANLIFISLWRVSGGTPTELASEVSQYADAGEYGVDDEFVLLVCYSNGRVLVNLYDGGTEAAISQVNLGVTLSHDVTLPEGETGLGTGTQTGEIRFLSFHLEEENCKVCQRECEIEKDSFNRVTVGDNWDQRSGTWIATGTELSTSSSDGLIITVDEAPSVKTVVRVKATSATSGGVPIVVISYVNDSNYLFVQIEEDGARTTATVRLMQRFGLSSAQLNFQSIAKDAGDTTAYVHVCYEGTAITCHVSWTNFQTPAQVLIASSASLAGVRAGLGVRGSSGAVTFDDFNFQRSALEREGCLDCASACDVCGSDFPAQRELVLDLGAGGWTNEDCDGCQGIQGEYVLTNNGTGCVWSYRECAICSFPGICVGFTQTNLFVSAEIVNRPSDKYRWQVTLLMYKANGAAPDCTLVSPDCISQRSVTYQSADFDKTGAYCQDFPKTLSLVADNWVTDGWCDGTAPATITLSDP